MGLCRMESQPERSDAAFPSSSSDSCASLFSPSNCSCTALIKASVLSSLCLSSLHCSLFCRYHPTSGRQTQTAACSPHLAAVWTAATLQPYQKSLWHTNAANKLITPQSIDSGLKQANFVLLSGQHR